MGALGPIGLGKGLRNKSWKDMFDPAGIGTHVKKAMGLEDPPPLPAPTPMPDEVALTAARRRRLAATLQRRGRSSTIMTDQTLGG